MATYFDGNQEIQAAVSSSAQGLQTLLLMNPTTYVQYSDTPPTPPQPPSNNLVFLNSSATGLSHAPPNTQQFVGIPLDPTSAEASTLHGLIHYNLYNPINNDPAARDTPRSQQALSLTLSSHRHRQHEYGSQDQSSDVSGEEDIRVVSAAAAGGSSVLSSVSGQLQGGGLLSSKYLKAAQELLDEVVTVKSHDHQLSTKNKSNISTPQVVGGGEAEDRKRGPEDLTTPERQEIQMKKAKLINMLDQVEQRYRQYHHQMQIVISLFEEAAGIGSAKTYTALALQTISKQFRCLKDAITAQIKTTNKSLGEEDIGIGPAAGAGKVEASSSSRLKFVDHQLRQQRALQHLGMMQHHNAWRPQRGLPERSVSVLRAWLFENFLHPYPKDSDKHMLAKQTGLTRSQVSNWFINARVRLWKPMVEEMYLEEIKEQELNNNNNNNSNNGSEDQKSKSSEQNEDSTENQTKSFKSLESSPNQNGSSISTTSPMAGAGIVGNHSGFSVMAELEGITQASPKKPRGTDFMHSPPTTTTTTTTTTITTGVSGINKDDDNMSMKFSNEREDRDGGYSFMGGQTNFINGGFGEYPIGEIARYDGEQSFTPSFSGNGVSLSLGLPHCENLSLSSPAPHHSFLPNQNNNNNLQLGRRVDIGHSNDFGAIPTTSVPHSSPSTPYDSINIQNRKRFAAQLLPDFVA